MQEIKQALASIEGVTAVGLGGSRGLGLADENSDYDFVLYRNGGANIAVSAIANALKPFSDTPVQLFDDVGMARTRICGKEIEVFQNNLAIVEREIEVAKLGNFRWSIKRLFPHGDLSTCMISHVVYLELCSEKANAVTNLRTRAQPFPLLLMDSLLKTFMAQALITIYHAEKIKKPHDAQYLLALCSAFIFFANIIIFAANGMYPVLERGGAGIIARLSLRPQNYEQRIPELYRACLDGRFEQACAEMRALLQELQSAIVQARQSRKHG